ncbi:MAG: RES family NAD+ phosphorylase [Shimia sp.]
MSPRTLREARTAWRIGDPMGEFPIWDDGGARRTPGRWHEAGAGVIYASFSYATAMLEKLVHYSGQLPRGQHFVEITIPAGTSYEVFSEAHHPRWPERGGEVARRFGAAWHAERRSAILIVPSVVARMERNVIFNTAHPEFGGVTVELETPVWWDERLFAP